MAWIGRTKDKSIRSLTDDYLKRLERYTPTEALEFTSDAALKKQLDRPGQFFVALDIRGRQFSSVELAEFLGRHQDGGTAALLFAVGGADGFPDGVRESAALQLSLGKMTLPHELARVVLLEQLYRGYTILKGHPYHLGH